MLVHSSLEYMTFLMTESDKNIWLASLHLFFYATNIFDLQLMLKKILN